MLCYLCAMQPAEQMRRSKRLAMGGTFLVAVSLAVQLGQQGELADDNLMITLDVKIIPAILNLDT